MRTEHRQLSARLTTVIRRIASLALLVASGFGAASQAAPSPDAVSPSPSASAVCATAGANASETTVKLVDRYRDTNVQPWPREPPIDIYRVATGLAGTAPLDLPSDTAVIERNIWGTPVAQDLGVSAWQAAVRRVDPAMISSLTDASLCRGLYAAQVLNRRIDELGATHPYVRQWLTVQEAIFKACGDTRPELPPALPADSPRITKLQNDDRAFQSAYVHAMPGPGTPDVAPLLAVSESDSEHRAAALYLVSIFSWELNAGAVAEAPGFEQFMANLLEDPALRAGALYARQVVGYFEAKSQSVEIARVLWRSLEKDLLTPAPDIARDAQLKTLYLNAVGELDSFGLFEAADWWLGPRYPDNHPRSQAIAEAATRSDLAAWVLARRSAREDGEQWRARAQAPAPAWQRLRDWLADHPPPAASRLAWLPIRAAFDLESEADLWREVDRQVSLIQTCAHTPGVAVLGSLFHEAFRASVLNDNLNGAIAGFKRFPFRDSDAARAAVDDALGYLLERRLLTAARHLRDATEAELGAGWRNSGNVTLARIAEDEAHLVKVLGPYPSRPLLEPLSIDAMTRLARNPDVEPLLRASLARVAWARSWVLSQRPPEELTALMLELNPVIEQWWQSLAPRAPTDTQRRLVFNLLQTPLLGRLQLVWADEDNFGVAALSERNPSDGNWWCPLNLAKLGKGSGYPWQQQTSNLIEKQSPLLNTYLGSHYDMGLMSKLANVASAPKMLSEEVIAWTEERGWLAERMGWVRGTDEALHHAVRVTRYGCRRDGGHGVYSQRAYQLLHQRYPQSAWAAKTPYWFDRVPTVEREFTHP